MRIDRFISNLARFNRQDARQLIAGGRLRIDGRVVRSGSLPEAGTIDRLLQES